MLRHVPLFFGRDRARPSRSGENPRDAISFSIVDRHDFVSGLFAMRFLFLRKNDTAGA